MEMYLSTHLITLARFFKNKIKALGVFSLGVFVGVCYGAVVATFTTYFLVSSL